MTARTRWTRREFVRLAGRGALALSAAGLGCAAGSSGRSAGRDEMAGGARESSAPRRALALLVLGGTGFLGPEIVRAAQARGHTLTLFNRGKTNPHLFPDVEKLRGDRDGGLSPLSGRRWDAVLDTSGYVPRVVRQSAELLAPAVRRYLFVSSISVYADFARPGMAEDAPLATLPPGEEKSEDVPKHYGALKAACERAVEASLPGRAIVVRPGLIVGPGDPTDRFTYWPVRVSAGGEVLAPGDGADPVQVIDVRDLAAFLVKLVEEEAAGAFNATGPGEPLAMRAMLEECRAFANPGARLVWVDEAFLAEHGVQPWSDMPVWVPRRGEMGGLAQTNVDRALARGLVFRPLRDTIRDTLDWWAGLPPDRRGKMRAGMTPHREREVLAKWKEQAS